MACVLDVAAYVLEACGEMTAMKLQKLVYYSKAWHLVWESTPLFPEAVQAWANGPVVRELYEAHKGKFIVSPGEIPGDPRALSPEEAGSVNGVINFYGVYSPFDLSELTHREDPWRNARQGLYAGERSEVIITDAAMAEYYESLSSGTR